MVPIEDDFKDQPKTLEAISGFLQCLHYDLFPTAEAKVKELTAHLVEMTKAVRFLRDSFAAGYEEVEAKEGEKTIIANLPQTITEKYWLGRILEPDMMNMLVNLWKQCHGDEEVDTELLQKANMEYEEAWQGFSAYLVERSEGDLNALNLQEEIRTLCREFSWVMYSTKINDKYVNWVRQLFKIKDILKNIASQLIKVDSAKSDLAEKVANRVSEKVAEKLTDKGGRPKKSEYKTGYLTQGEVAAMFGPPCTAEKVANWEAKARGAKRGSNPPTAIVNGERYHYSEDLRINRTAENMKTLAAIILDYKSRQAIKQNAKDKPKKVHAKSEETLARMRGIAQEESRKLHQNP